MTLEEVLIKEGLRRGYALEMICDALEFARCLVCAGRSEVARGQLSEAEKCFVRGVFGEAMMGEGGVTQRIIERN